MQIVVERQFPLERTRRLQALQNGLPGLEKVLPVLVRVEERRSELAEEGLPEAGEIGSEVGRGKTDQAIDRTGLVDAAARRPCGVPTR